MLFICYMLIILHVYMLHVNYITVEPVYLESLGSKEKIRDKQVSRFTGFIKTD